MKIFTISRVRKAQEPRGLTTWRCCIDVTVAFGHSFGAQGVHASRSGPLLGIETTPEYCMDKRNIGDSPCFRGVCCSIHRHTTHACTLALGA